MSKQQETWWQLDQAVDEQLYCVFIDNGLLSLFLINPETNQLEAHAALGVEKDKLKFDYRLGIAGSVFTIASGNLLVIRGDCSDECIDKISSVAEYSERIIAFREQHGGFKMNDDLMKVKGIGKKTYQKIKPFLVENK